jgi:DinB family protein
MPLPAPVEALWTDLEASRAQVLKEVEGLSQAQADWRPSETDWSIGEIIHHLTLAEIGTGKITSKVLREAGEAVRPFPTDLKGFAPMPAPPPGRAEAPAAVWPEFGKPLTELMAALTTVRARSRETIERLARVDPQPLIFSHQRLGRLDLAQWWMLQAKHDATHLEQIRGIKAAADFPRA